MRPEIQSWDSHYLRNFIMHIQIASDQFLALHHSILLAFLLPSVDLKTCLIRIKIILEKRIYYFYVGLMLDVK